MAGNPRAVIERAENVTGVDPTLKATRIAEAHFIRGLYYFWLVQMYGGVDVSLTENKGVKTDAYRQSPDSVYNVVISDLQYAVDSAGLRPGHEGRGAALPRAGVSDPRVQELRASW